MSEKCCVCGCEGEKDDLRPYGPGGKPICYPCGTSPERIKETEERVYALIGGLINPAVETGIPILIGGGPPRLGYEIFDGEPEN